MRGLLTGLALLATLTALAVVLSLSSGSPGTAQAANSPRCVPAHLNTSAALAGGQVTVSPAPGTRDSSSSTQISMLGVPAAELTGVSVKGSRTGAHSGRLIAYSQGDGASFLPSRPFSDGESVTVHATLKTATASVPFAWGFTVAVRDTAGSAHQTAPPHPQSSDHQSFRSRPDLKPPVVDVTAHSPLASPGDIFLAPYTGPGQYGPMILDESGRLVWFKALPTGTRAADFRVQEYEGKPALTWWQNPLDAGANHKSGIVIANSAYETIATVRAGNGYQVDLHEFQIRPQDTALITVYDAIDCDLTADHGKADAAVADTLTQEIDLKTGLVRFEWHSLDHVPLSNAYTTLAFASRTIPFDYFHINAVDVMANGDLLIDSRDTWAAYDINRKTGVVQWELGGKRSSFKMGRGTRPAYQHDARVQPDGTITFFDNGATPPVHPQSRAIQLSLDMTNKTATLARIFEHSKPLISGSQGNVQALAGGDWMVGWGQAPYFTEVNAGGQLLFDAHLPSAYENYRSFRLPWSGTPKTAPSLSVTAAHGKKVLYASWNGSTVLARWRVLAGASATTLATYGSDTLKNGFETSITLPAGAPGPYVAVQALDASGTVIAVSRVLKS